MSVIQFPQTHFIFSPVLNIVFNLIYVPYIPL